jgi:hypothetical protein
LYIKGAAQIIIKHVTPLEVALDHGGCDWYTDR